MMLAWVVLLPLLAAPLAWRLEVRRPGAARWLCLAALAADAALTLWLWAGQSAPMPGRPGLAGWQAAWIPRWGITVHLAMDGISLPLLLLTDLLGAMAVVASWTEIRERAGFFYFNLLLTLAGVLGVFLAMDLFLFFVCWEVMLVPMYALITIWGHERRAAAGLKFFIFTQAGSLLLLIAMVALVLLHQRETGVLTFDYPRLLGTPLAPTVAAWLMAGFALAFAVKLPVVPLHTWLPDAHTEAPTGGSVLLAGLLLKTGAYGLLRFAIPLFPEPSLAAAPLALLLGVAGVLYGAILSFAQTDVKRLVAYSSVSHMGFVMIGLYAWNGPALQGVMMQLVAHGLSTGALFMVAGALQERLHTRNMREMGGLWAAMPRLGGTALVFAVASLGLPGLANFAGEFLVLLGAYRRQAALTAVALLGLVLAAAYALALLHRTFFGPLRRSDAAPADLSPRGTAAFGVLIVLLVVLGLHPQSLFQVTGPALDGLQAAVAPGRTAMGP